MKCPKCGATSIKVLGPSITSPEEGREAGYRGGYVEIEMWCNVCEDTVAFYRVRDEDWIEIP